MLTALTLAGCNKSEQDSLEISVSSLDFSYFGEEKTFTIESNTKWTVSSNETWLTVSSASGANNSTVTVTTAANSSTNNRTGTITVSGGAITRTISVTQAEAPEFFTVIETSLSFPATAERRTITIASNINWVVSCNETWLTVSPASGSNKGTVTVTAAENTSIERWATITVIGGEITKTIRVTQLGTRLSLSTSSMSFSPSEEQKTFTISSNTNWEVSNNETWLTVSPASGSSDGTITVTAAKNASTSQRTATITVSGGDITRTISVTQAKISLSISAASMTLLASARQRTFTITSNVSWVVSSSETWLTVSPASGSNNGTVTITAAENTSIERTATITVKAGDITQTINITQEGTFALTVSRTSISVSASGEYPENESGRFYITSNTNWVVSCNEKWLTVSPTSGSNDGSFIVTPVANTSTSSRTATITVSGGGITRTISVTQSAAVEMGSVTFWTSSDKSCGIITVTLSGRGTKWITKYYIGGSPACGSDGTATFADLPSGTYSYTASCIGRSWSGSVTRTLSCHRIRLN